MTQGESIAPNADKTMKVVGVGSAARSSIDPTDYMGQSFVYEEWLKKKQKEYENEKERVQSQSIEGRDTQKVISEVGRVSSSAQQAIDLAKKQSEEFKSSPEFESWKQKSIEAKKSYFLNDYVPATGGTFTMKTFAYDNYMNKYNDAKQEVDTAMSMVKEAKTQSDLDVANKKLQEATSKFQKIASTNPTSEEGKQLFKDEMVSGVNTGAKYAAGWGVGGWHGTGKDSIGRRDQMEANVTGGRVGGAIPVATMSPSEIMASQGFSLATNPDTGELGYFKVGADGKIQTDSSGNKIQYTGGFQVQGQPYWFRQDNGQWSYGVKGGGLQQFKISDKIGEANAAVYEKMLDRFAASNQKVTLDQAKDIVNTLFMKDQIDKHNILDQKVKYAEMFPTDDNKKDVLNYQMALSQNAASDFGRIVQTVIDKGGERGVIDAGIIKSGDPNRPVLGRTSVGSVGGLKIYSDKSGKEYVDLPGVTAKFTGGTMSLAQLTDLRQQAGKTGEYNLYNYTGVTGVDNLNTTSQDAKTALGKILPGGYKEEYKPIVQIGSIKLEGEELPIFKKTETDREYVKLKTGGEAPLSAIVALKELSSGRGVYAKDPDLRNAQLDFITSYKLSLIDPTGDNISRRNESYNNLYSNPNFTKEMREQMESMVNVGGKFAGLKYDNENKQWTATDDVAKSTLKFSSQAPLKNVQDIGLFSREDLSKQQIHDISKSLAKYGGDPLIGMSNVKMMLERNPEIMDLSPKVNAYKSTIDLVAKEASRFEPSRGMSSNPMQGLVNYRAPQHIINKYFKENDSQSAGQLSVYDIIQKHYEKQDSLPSTREISIANRVEGPWTPKDWSVKASVPDTVSIINEEKKSSKLPQKDYKPLISGIVSFSKSPTVVTDQSKVYAKISTASPVTNKKVKGVLPNITTTVFRKSKASTPKVNIKKKDKKVKVNSLEISNIGNFNFEMPKFNKEEKKSKPKKLNDIISSTLSSFKLKNKL